MPNQNGRAYGLTTLCPIKGGGEGNRSYASIVRERLETLGVNEQSPWARVPNTYLSRLYVLDDVVFEGKPAREEHLKSAYLVFVADLHGALDDYLRGMWRAAEADVKRIWTHCVGFDAVRGAEDFVAYINKCQVKTTFFFNGSNDLPLAEQLKGLYLKQEFSKFAFENQGKPPAELQRAFQEFVRRTKPAALDGPTWRAGASSLESAVVGEGE